MNIAMENSSTLIGSKISTFTDLKAWQEGHKLVLAIYEITKTFPKDEQFGLTSQIRRAAVSVTSNIAEGFARTSSKEKCHFYSFAMGSVTEVLNQLIISKDVGYVSLESYKFLYEQLTTASKLTKALLKKTQSWSP